MRGHPLDGGPNDLLKRMDPYWKMEAANVVFAPVFLILLAGGKVGWITLVPTAATVLLLVIDALYWRGKVRQLRGDGSNLPALLHRLGTWKSLALALTLAGCAAPLAGWWAPAWSAGLTEMSLRPALSSPPRNT